MPFLTIHQMVSFPTDGGTQTLVHVAEDQLLGIFFSKIILFLYRSLPSLDATLANSLYCGVLLYRAFCPVRGDIYHIIEKL